MVALFVVGCNAAALYLFYKTGTPQAMLARWRYRTWYRS